MTVNADTSCTATFEIVQHSLSVSTTGAGSGTVTSAPAGIDCGADCSEPYDEGTVVTLTATPDAGSTFTGWSGDADCTDGSVTIDADTTCSATFEITQHSLNVSTSGGALPHDLFVRIEGGGGGGGGCFLQVLGPPAEGTAR